MSSRRQTKKPEAAGEAPGQAGDELGRLLAAPEADQRRLGYYHTAREIAQQPRTWPGTAALAAEKSAELARALAQVRDSTSPGTLVLTGSGSSHYAAECVAPGLQAALGITALAVPAGEVLTHADARLPPRGPLLLVSFGRSGNSPESCAVIDLLLEKEARCRHLVVTCNREGLMATRYRGHAKVLVLVLDDATNDRSLVMTSSVTNMALAAAALGSVADLARYKERAARVASAASALLATRAAALAEAARGPFASAAYLGSGPRHGAAREAALKMLEMTGGQVLTMAETWLGLRHGPISALRGQALIVAFLSTEPVARAYELDVLREIRRKRLGTQTVIVGCGLPDDAVQPEDVAVSTAAGIEDGDAALLDVVVGQLLAFFRCRHVGLRPDQPSEDGVISRVVEPFTIHRRS